MLQGTAFGISWPPNDEVRKRVCSHARCARRRPSAAQCTSPLTRPANLPAFVDPLRVFPSWTHLDVRCCQLAKIVISIVICGALSSAATSAIEGMLARRSGAVKPKAQ